ncbi:MAG: crossover junction endodeoxyribonuclease RuvC [Candidatus Buchananbacteria bacterium]|nr:crossover junction endodeoxyribonuclease RuvC [Candidatus Buchananbacteria bacterium]
MPKSKKTKIILGIDPGIADTGFGIIKVEGNEFKIVTCGSIKTKAHQPTEDRLKIIYQDIQTLIKKYKPATAGVEQLFFAKNAKTAMVVGQARGVIMLTLAQANLSIKEFTPLQVKIGLTGYGQASKKQIQEVVKTILKLKTVPKPDDAADALAIAICAANI